MYIHLQETIKSIIARLGPLSHEYAKVYKQELHQVETVLHDLITKLNLQMGSLTAYFENSNLDPISFNSRAEQVVDIFKLVEKKEQEFEAYISIIFNAANESKTPHLLYIGKSLTELLNQIETQKITVLDGKNELDLMVSEYKYYEKDQFFYELINKTKQELHLLKKEAGVGFIQINIENYLVEHRYIRQYNLRKLPKGFSSLNNRQGLYMLLAECFDDFISHLSDFFFKKLV